MPVKQLRDRDLKRLRAVMMIQDRVMGMSVLEIAKKFNCSMDTVERALQWARKEDLVREQETKLLEDLVPKAMGAIQMALEDGDAQVALEILKGTNILKKQKDPNKTTVTSDQGGDDDWENLLNGLTGGGGAIDGTIVGAEPPRLLGPAEPSTTTEVAETDHSGELTSLDSTPSGQTDGKTAGKSGVSPLEVIANLRSRAEI